LTGENAGNGSIERRTCHDQVRERAAFTLGNAPASDFPTVEDIRAQQTLTIAQPGSEALAGQDSFFDGAAGRALLPQRHVAGVGRARVLRTVATDGHRLAFCESALDSPIVLRLKQVIVPRKGVSWSCKRCLGNEGHGGAGNRQQSQFALRSAIFALLRSSLTGRFRNMAA
jgi:hypothetical protein